MVNFKLRHQYQINEKLATSIRYNFMYQSLSTVIYYIISLALASRIKFRRMRNNKTYVLEQVDNNIVMDTAFQFLKAEYEIE